MEVKGYGSKRVNVKTENGDLMKIEILAMLRNTETYLSGQEICNYFGVSRTAIWKHMNALKEEGYEIETLKNKGYKLVSCPDTLSNDEISSRLHTKYIGKNLVYHEETDSTNIDAKRMAEEGAPHGTLIVANMQRTGRGRRGREWQSPAGEAVYMSILLRPSFDPDKASMLTLVMALSVGKAIKSMCQEPISIKWPNDVIMNGKKVCGILTEMNAETGYIHYVVIGVGINVNTTQFQDDIEGIATSLFLETGNKVIRAELAEKIITNFELYYDIFCETEDLSKLQQEYCALLITKDCAVKVMDPKGDFQGIARGINEVGELLVEKEDGEVVKVYSGEVSVRGLYGYV
ncbi:MAG TPA: biotin--[acetyl-CoA-carboxylase] ligase [Lachnospiraceae bacterium]|nr:biotin--[acetyl-CoA-carboxylase] ligase [Lachnospiraceae bacterium]